MRIKTGILPLQRAIYSRLANDSVLSRIITGVFDEVPDNTAFPYVTIGEDTVNPYDNKTSVGEDVTLTIHCWSEGPGKTQAKEMMDAVLQSLTGSPIILEGNFKVDGVKREFLNVLPDGVGYHGICRFRFYINHI